MRPGAGEAEIGLHVLDRIFVGVGARLKPQVVFLDEPTLGLDPDGALQMLEVIRSMSQDKRITVFFSSHLLDQVQKISHRVGIMLKGDMVVAICGPQTFWSGCPKISSQSSST